MASMTVAAFMAVDDQLGQRIVDAGIFLSDLVPILVPSIGPLAPEAVGIMAFMNLFTIICTSYFLWNLFGLFDRIYILFRASGDFEADPKRSDSEPIPYRKVCFLTFICSLNTFQSKNPPYSLSNLHFKLDEKMGKRAQKLQEETVKPRSEIQNVRGERMLRFSLVPQSTSNSVSEAGTKI